jgi:hypothetical protein
MFIFFLPVSNKKDLYILIIIFIINLINFYKFLFIPYIHLIIQSILH